MTDDDICNLLDKLKVPDQWDDSILIEFARAIEKASRNAALEDAIDAANTIGSRSNWSQEGVAECVDAIRALANGDSNG